MSEESKEQSVSVKQNDNTSDVMDVKTQPDANTSPSFHAPASEIPTPDNDIKVEDLDPQPHEIEDSEVVDDIKEEKETTGQEQQETEPVDGDIVPVPDNDIKVEKLENQLNEINVSETVANVEEEKVKETEPVDPEMPKPTPSPEPSTVPEPEAVPAQSHENIYVEDEVIADEFNLDMALGGDESTTPSSGSPDPTSAPSSKSQNVAETKKGDVSTDVALGPSKEEESRPFLFRYRRAHCIRHLRGILARNLNPHPRHLVNTFFSLHFLTEDGTAGETIYSSETLSKTLNPSWMQLEESMLNNKSIRNLTSFFLNIWRCPSNTQPVVLCSFPVQCNALCYIGQDANVLQSFPMMAPNTIFFDLVDGLFVLPSTFEEFLLHGVTPATRPSIHPDCLTWTLTQTHLGRFKGLNRSITRVETEANEKAATLNTLLDSHRAYFLRRRTLDAYEARLAALRKEIARHKSLLVTDKVEFEDRRSKLLPRARAAAHGLETLLGSRDVLSKSVKALEEKRAQLHTISLKLTKRRQQMLRTLHDIYMPAPQKGAGFTVCGVALPQFHRQSGQLLNAGKGDYDLSAIALGFTCSLVQHISTILDVPCRFPLNPLGAKSTIFDFIAQTSEKDAEFPLSCKGEIRSRYEYAVGLLNADVAQLLSSQGIRPSPPRPAVFSLKALLLSPKTGYVRSLLGQEAPELFKGVEAVVESEPLSPHDPDDPDAQELPDEGEPNEDVSPATQAHTYVLEEQDAKSKRYTQHLTRHPM